jgi:plastocyanin
LRKLQIVLALLAALAVAAVGSSAVNAGATKNVTVDDDFYKPTKITIAKGTQVRWNWKGTTSNKHTVTDLKNRFGSKTKRRGTYKHTFRKAGKFTIYCKVHPIDMRMRVVVK